MVLSTWEKKTASQAAAERGADILERLLGRSSYESIVVAIYAAMQRQQRREEAEARAARLEARRAANTPWNTPPREARPGDWSGAKGEDGPEAA